MASILALTNVFGRPWDLTRGPYNQIVLDKLALENDLTLLVPLSLVEVIKHWRVSLDLLFRGGSRRWPSAKFFLYLYLPKFSQPVNAGFMFAAILFQFPYLILFKRWDCFLSSWLYPDAVTLSWFGRLRRIPCIAHAIGSDVNIISKRPLQRWQIRHSLSYCSSVITVSRNLQETLNQVPLAQEKLKTIYNGVDSTLFKPLDRAEARLTLGLPLRESIVLFVGRLSNAKGIFELLKAFSVLVKSAPDSILVLVGENYEKDAIARLINELELSTKVQIIGIVQANQLGTWYAAANILCLPSHMEGVPNVIMEAMATGIPTVATDVGGIAEVLPPFAGILVPVKTVDQLSCALEVALNSKWDRLQIRNHALTFTWDGTVRQFQALIDSAITSNTS